jgi:hypothetical protein
MHEDLRNKIRKKPEALDTIPEGFRFDQDAVWERLKSKLALQARRKKKYRLYRAVSLALIIIIPAIILFAT